MVRVSGSDVGPNGRDQSHTPGGDPTYRKGAGTKGGGTGEGREGGEWRERVPGAGVGNVQNSCAF